LYSYGVCSARSQEVTCILMKLQCEVTGSYLYSYGVAVRGLRKLLECFPFLSHLFKLTFLAKRTDILYALPFDI